MEKFPILCTLSAVIVFLGAALGAAGVQTEKKDSLPFGSHSVEMVQESAAFAGIIAPALQQLDLSRGTANAPYLAMESVPIRGELLISF